MRKMALLLTWLWLSLGVLCFPGHQTDAGRHRRCKVFRKDCHRLSAGDQHSTLTCPNGAVLFAPSVTASVTSNGGCKGHRNCTGYQVNGLVRTNNCFWKPSCEIDYYSSMLVLADDRACIGQIPNVLQTAFRCVRSDEIVTMKNNSHSDDVTLSQGIVKSHDKFPWHFRRGMRASVVLKSPDPKNRKLLISVYKADVDWEDDVVTIAANDVTVSLNAESARLPPMNGPDVNISLRFDANSRMVAEGFVLCFKWLKQKKEVGNDYNVCDKIQVCPEKQEKMRNRNGNGNGNGKRRGKNRRKKAKKKKKSDRGGKQKRRKGRKGSKKRKNRKQ